MVMLFLPWNMIAISRAYHLARVVRISVALIFTPTLNSVDGFLSRLGESVTLVLVFCAELGEMVSVTPLGMLL
jgi:hypothetical protein